MRQRSVSLSTTLPPGEERLVRQRLRTIIQLAIAIGRREGLITSESHTEGDYAGHSDESYATTLKSTRAEDS